MSTTHLIERPVEVNAADMWRALQPLLADWDHYYASGPLGYYEWTTTDEYTGEQWQITVRLSDARVDVEDPQHAEPIARLYVEPDALAGILALLNVPVTS